MQYIPNLNIKNIYNRRRILYKRKYLRMNKKRDQMLIHIFNFNEETFYIFLTKWLLFFPFFKLIYYILKLLIYIIKEIYLFIIDIKFFFFFSFIFYIKGKLYKFVLIQFLLKYILFLISFIYYILIFDYRKVLYYLSIIFYFFVDILVFFIELILKFFYIFYLFFRKIIYFFFIISSNEILNYWLNYFLNYIFFYKIKLFSFVYLKKFYLKNFKIFLKIIYIYIYKFFCFFFEVSKFIYFKLINFIFRNKGIKKNNQYFSEDDNSIKYYFKKIIIKYDFLKHCIEALFILIVFIIFFFYKLNSVCLFLFWFFLLKLYIILIIFLKNFMDIYDYQKRDKIYSKEGKDKVLYILKYLNFFYNIGLLWYFIKKYIKFSYLTIRWVNYVFYNIYFIRKLYFYICKYLLKFFLVLLVIYYRLISILLKDLLIFFFFNNIYGALFIYWIIIFIFFDLIFINYIIIFFIIIYLIYCIFIKFNLYNSDNSIELNGNILINLYKFNYKKKNEITLIGIILIKYNKIYYEICCNILKNYPEYIFTSFLKLKLINNKKDDYSLLLCLIEGFDNNFLLKYEIYKNNYYIFYFYTIKILNRHFRYYINYVIIIGSGTVDFCEEINFNLSTFTFNELNKLKPELFAFMHKRLKIIKFLLYYLYNIEYVLYGTVESHLNKNLYGSYQIIIPHKENFYEMLHLNLRYDSLHFIDFNYKQFCSYLYELEYCYNEEFINFFYKFYLLNLKLNYYEIFKEKKRIILKFFEKNWKFLFKLNFESFAELIEEREEKVEKIQWIKRFKRIKKMQWFNKLKRINRTQRFKRIKKIQWLSKLKRINRTQWFKEIKKSNRIQWWNRFRNIRKIKKIK